MTLIRYITTQVKNYEQERRLLRHSALGVLPILSQEKLLEGVKCLMYVGFKNISRGLPSLLILYIPPGENKVCHEQTRGGCRFLISKPW